MKKMISLLMALVMVFTFAACGGPDILGTYEVEFDLTQLVCDEFDKGAGIDGTEMSLSNYLDDFTITMISEFNEDGTYSQYADSASLEAALDNMAAAIAPVMNDFMLYTFAEEFSAYGYNIETREDVEALLGIEWDNIFSTVLGMDMDSFISEMMTELSTDLFEDSMLQEGNYKAVDGKLYLSDGLEYDIDETIYETYEMDGNNVIITGSVNLEEDEYLPYPYTMVKVS